MRNYFTEIPGNDTLRRRIGEEIERGALSHAYIIEGTKGYGKGRLALEMAMALACEHRTDNGFPLPCGTCRHCRKIKEGLCPDIIRIRRPEDKATMGVETVREIREGLAVVPNDLDFKIYVIEDAHTMTTQAQNALLLSLEEPPAFVRFFLLAEDAGALLETVRSRAPIYRMLPLSRDALHAHLQKQSTAAALARENPDEYAALLTMAAGSAGRAEALLEPRTRAPLLKRRRFAEDVVTALATGKSAGELTLLFAERGVSRDEITADLSALQNILRDLTLATRAEHPPLLFFADHVVAEELATRFSTARLLRLSAVVAAASDALAVNANVRLTLTHLIRRIIGS